MTELTGLREAELLEAANLLLDARRTHQPMGDLPLALRPANFDEAFQVQDTIAEAFGPVGGWKVGAASSEADPLCAPMPAAWIGPDGVTLNGHTLRGVEAEVAFLLGEDLPPRAARYTREEVLGAVLSCHPAIEVLASGLDMTTACRLSQVADLQVHGGFVFGPAFRNWQRIDFTREQVSLTCDGIVRVERTGSNTAGDLLRLLPWLANQPRTGGLRAGQWITTGSWTGCTYASADATVKGHFSTLGTVGLHFG